MACTTRPVPRAIVATERAEVRDFLRVHLEDRGFAVEIAHRLEYLRIAAPGADLLVADLALLRALELAEASRPGETIALDASPTLDGALSSRSLGAAQYLGVPFADTTSLAALLDAAAARAAERVVLRPEAALAR